MLPRRILQVALTLLALVFVPVLTSQAVAAAVVHCCCGPHEAADHCGCPDCPSGHDGDERRRSDDGHARFVSCASGELPTLLTLAFVVPARFVLVAPSPAPPPRPVLPAPHPPPPLEPVTPPPRAGAAASV